jgi:GxxExxY protein
MQKILLDNGHGNTRNYTEEIHINFELFCLPWRAMMLAEEQLSYVIRGCVYEVFRQSGCGFLEKVYENALLSELRLRGLQADPQVPVSVRYKSEIVGEYFADILVEETVIIELKAQPHLTKANEAQLLNYLKATGLHIGMLVNFTYPRATIKRFVI